MLRRMTALPRPPAARRRDYPGWWMVWALSVTTLVGYGALFYAFAVFVVPMREDLGASTAQLSLALSLSIATAGAAAVPVGRLLDRHGARWLMTGGSLLAAASVALWSRAGDLPTLYLAFVGIGLAGAAVLYDPAFAVVNTWFLRDRGTALLTITVVAGFASTVFLPASQALVGALGWRSALLVLAALLAACAVPHAVLLRRSPADLGLPVDGRPGAPHPAAEDPVDTGPTGTTGALRRPAVRWLTLAAALEATAVTVVAVHLVAYLRDTGAAAGTAASAAGALGVLSVAGRVVLTGLAGRVGLGRLTSVMVAGQAVGVGGLLVLPRPAGLVVFVVLFGAGFGVMTIARAALLGGYVAVGVFGSVAGGQALVSGLGRVVAPAAGGALITAAGYELTFILVAALALACAASLVAAEREAVAAFSRPTAPAGPGGPTRPAPASPPR